MKGRIIANARDMLAITTEHDLRQRLLVLNKASNFMSLPGIP
jgi:hypothetical protein